MKLISFLTLFYTLSFAGDVKITRRNGPPPFCEVSGIKLASPDGTFPTRCGPAFFAALEKAVITAGYDTDDATTFLYRGRAVAKWEGGKLVTLTKQQ